MSPRGFAYVLYTGFITWVIATMSFITMTTPETAWWTAPMMIGSPFVTSLIAARIFRYY